MVFTDVVSSYIKQVGWEDSGKIKIIFRSGYEEVREGTRGQYEALCCAKSVGKHYNEFMKKLPVWKPR